MAEAHTPPRFRVIAGALYARETTPTAHRVRVHELGNGHLEATVLPHYLWHEVDALSDQAASDAAMAHGHIWVDGRWVPADLSESEKLDRLAKNRERSTRRARTQVRRLCKAKGLTTMLTFTYQENMHDRDRIARDFDVMVKRLRRVAPDFQYVCVFERQKRGAWHAHVAVPRVLSHYAYKGQLVRSYDLLRSMWRSIIGGGGNVDVSRNKRIARSSARLASYLAKYIGKDLTAALAEGDSYRASGRALPKPTYVTVAGDLGWGITALLDLIESDIARPGAKFHHALLDCGGYYVELSPS